MKDRRKDTETCIAAILFLDVCGKDLIAREWGQITPNRLENQLSPT